MTGAGVAATCVVAVGSSADGFRALGAIVRALPADFGGAVVIVQHQSPRAPSRLAALLALETPLLVREAVDGEPVWAGRVYLAPPDRHLVVEDRCLRLLDTPKVNHARPSIDVLFDSVAGVYGRQAIGVVLSGGGVDGAQGLQAIRRAGGRTVVQSPAGARIAGMPRAAIGLDGIEFVVDLHEIGALMARLVSAGSGAPASAP